MTGSNAAAFHGDEHEYSIRSHLRPHFITNDAEPNLMPNRHLVKTKIRHSLDRMCYPQRNARLSKMKGSMRRVEYLKTYVVDNLLGVLS